MMDRHLLPMVVISTGRWADVAWALHRCLMPTAIAAPLGSPRWLALRSPDPGHPGYATHQAWREALATGYATALVVHDTEPPEVPLPPPQAQRLGAGAALVPAGRLAEWVLDDLAEETPGVRG